jgi:hypothetical protein
LNTCDNGEKVVVTKVSSSRYNFNEVGATGIVTGGEYRDASNVDFGPEHGERAVRDERLALAPETLPAPPASRVREITIEPQVILGLVKSYVKTAYGIDQDVFSVTAHDSPRSMHKFGTPSSCKIEFAL